MPGVRQASNTTFRPWIGGGSSWEVKIAGGNDAKFRSQFYFVDPEVMETLGVTVVEGRNLTRQEYETTDLQANRPVNVVISRGLAELIFPDGQAVGKQMLDPDETVTIIVVGVFDPFYNPYGWPIHEYATLVPGRNGSRNGWSYLVRTAPGQRDAVAGEIERVLLGANDGRNVEVRSIEDIRATYESANRALVDVLNAVMVLLVVVTALGILGITSFAVAERQRQIGTRRALGATRGQILRHFLLENWLVTTLGIVLGVALAFVLNLGLVNVVEGAKLDLGVVAGGVVLLWLIGQLATLGPALRAARVPPAVATRSV
jgi:putative ABC transport system permease protein